MVETIRFRKIYLEDLRTGSGTESVTLADGSIVALTKISLSSLGGAGSLDYLELAEQSSTPSTPSSGTVRIYRKTDNKQYLLDDAGTETEWPFTVGTITSGVWNGTAIAAGYGGTGLATYVVGDLLYASAATTLAKLAAVATGQALVSQGAATAPAWSAAPTLTSLTLSATAALTLAFSGALPRLYVGSTGLTFYNNAGTSERMRLTDGGILALGTTQVTGASAGNIVVPYGAAGVGGLRSVVTAGTSTMAVIHAQTWGGVSNAVVISADGQDIAWGVPLVALGGGAAPTLGTIGGSGPTVAGQNTWMRIIDSGGNAFWVPAWK